MNLQFGKHLKVTHQIHKGQYSEILCAVNQRIGIKYALKIELKNAKEATLKFEYMRSEHLTNYKMLSDNCIAIPHIIYENLDDKYNIMLMDLLGPNLEDLFSLCGGRFSLKTVLMLADQMIECLEYIHSKQYIHKNIKPANFLIGIGKRAQKLYIIDFGLAKRYPQKIGPRMGCYHSPFEGSERFASIYAHQNIEGVNRCDDLESIAYIMIYFLKGQLPWQKLGGFNKYNRLENIKKKKISTLIDDLCEGLPQEIAIYLTYVRNLRQNWIYSSQEPDHSYLRSLLKGLFDKSGFQMDHIYDWNLIQPNDAKLAQTHIYDWNLIKLSHAQQSQPKAYFQQQQAQAQSPQIQQQSVEECGAQFQKQEIQLDQVQAQAQIQVQVQITQLEQFQSEYIYD